MNRLFGLLIAGLVVTGCGSSNDGTTDAGQDTIHDTAMDGTESDVPEPYGFEEYPWMTLAPDLDHRLCAHSDDPESAPDKTFIDCEMEGESFAPPDEPPRDTLLVMAWNLERGKHLEGQITLLRDDPEVPLPDVLLVSEADRGCSRSGNRHVTRDRARRPERSPVRSPAGLGHGRAVGRGGTVWRPSPGV